MKTLEFAAGLLFTCAITSASAVTRYVDVNSTNPTPPYTNWATAANVIQDAIDAADSGDRVLVTNGVYQTGGRAVYGTMTNRVAIEKPLIVESVNGPDFTIIQGLQFAGVNGDGSIRCAYLTADAGLFGFTLAGGATQSNGVPEATSGGGVWCASSASIISNCILRGNSAPGFGGAVRLGTLLRCVISNNFAGGGNVGLGGGGGGGVSGSVVYDSFFIGNSSSEVGGGALVSTLINCILVGNSASRGGGVAEGALINCTLADNFATYYGGGAWGLSRCYLTNCILAGNNAGWAGPDGYGNEVFGGSSIYLRHCLIGGDSATNGVAGFRSIVNCITNDPGFLDPASGDWRLESGSLCINSGDSSVVTTGEDFDGNPRISGGTVDIGAYEFQSPASQISYAWLQQYGFTNDGSADFADTDDDLHNNWQEWRAGTIPTNSSSVLQLLNPTNGPSGVVVNWQSVSGRTYFLQRATDLTSLSLLPLKSNILGQAGSTSYTDTNATGDGPFFYRVGVQE